MARLSATTLNRRNSDATASNYGEASFSKVMGQAAVATTFTALVNIVNIIVILLPYLPVLFGPTTNLTWICSVLPIIIVVLIPSAERLPRTRFADIDRPGRGTGRRQWGRGSVTVQVAYPEQPKTTSCPRTPEWMGDHVQVYRLCHRASLLQQGRFIENAIIYQSIICPMSIKLTCLDCCCIDY